MSRKVNVQITIDLERLARLDALAARIAGNNRSDAIRQLVDASEALFLVEDGTRKTQNGSVNAPVREAA